MTASSSSVADVRRLLRDAPFPWWIAGGRGLDLFAERELRPHEDVDVAVLRRDEPAIRAHLEGWDLHVAVEPGELVPWSEPLAPDQHAVWCRRDPASPWAFELLFNEADGDAWLFRRDHGVRMPLRSVGRRTVDGVPYLAPEVILLFKAKRARPRDEGDLDAVLPLLDAEARGWLRLAIERVHPGHRWLERLG